MSDKKSISDQFFQSQTLETSLAYTIAFAFTVYVANMPNIRGTQVPLFFCTGNLWVMDVGCNFFSNSDRVLSPWTGKMLVELITFKEMVWFKPQKASNQTKGICYRHRHSLYRKLCSNPRADIESRGWRLHPDCLRNLCLRPKLWFFFLSLKPSLTLSR